MPLEQPLAACLFSHFSCYLQETCEDTSLWLGLSPLDTGTPDSPLMRWNCFIDFAIEHWFVCRATEPGFTGDIGAIESELIDWLNEWMIDSICIFHSRTRVFVIDRISANQPTYNWYRWFSHFSWVVFLMQRIHHVIACVCSKHWAIHDQCMACDSKLRSVAAERRSCNYTKDNWPSDHTL